jgi:hypothetical protein
VMQTINQKITQAVALVGHFMVGVAKAKRLDNMRRESEGVDGDKYEGVDQQGGHPSPDAIMRNQVGMCLVWKTKIPLGWSLETWRWRMLRAEGCLP